MKWIKRSEIPSLECVQDFDKLLNVFDNDELSEFQYIAGNNCWVPEMLKLNRIIKALAISDIYSMFHYGFLS